MIKAKPWNNKDLSGTWDVTLKLDGVRALRKDGKVVSRNGKPLYNLDHLDFSDAEIYLGDWETTVSAVRTRNSSPVKEEYLYSLDPLDSRLYIKTLVNPTREEILAELNAVVDKYEGLVLRNGFKWLKVKPSETYDVRISGIQYGTGKYQGMLGAFITAQGNVGTGFTDEQRRELLSTPVGTYIEVECMEFTKNGMFRHPRFKRVRFDK